MHRNGEEYESEERKLLSSGSIDHSRDNDYELDDHNTPGSEPESPTHSLHRQSRHNAQWLPPWISTLLLGVRRPWSTTAYFGVSIRRRRRRPLARIICLAFATISCAVLTSLFVCAIFFPSYSNPPDQYSALRKRGQDSQILGRANINNEKVYVAASLYDRDGELVGGSWGHSMLELIDMLGPDNVFLSIYENNPDSKAKEALSLFAAKVPCNDSIVTENLNFNQLPHVLYTDGTLRLKRITYLAEVRNRALRALDGSVRFDKLLYINDIVFSPIDAANLLLSTNLDPRTGRTDYRAACATDFVNPFKYYDTYATRDAEGNSLGVPFFPWFANAGKAVSRSDVLAQKDAVRVSSCWGGMVAFEAKWFQPMIDHHGLETSNHPSTATSTTCTTAASTSTHATKLKPEIDSNLTWSLDSPLGENFPLSQHVRHSTNITNLPLRFRAETDTFWDSSECCLIHADLQAVQATATNNAPSANAGIYLNPYIRVAYHPTVLAWLPFAQHFERLYPPIHHLANLLGGRPGSNPRRLQQPGEEIEDVVWTWDQDTRDAMQRGNLSSLPRGVHGNFQRVRRKVLPGGFCGVRQLLLLTEDPEEGLQRWEDGVVPSMD